jgi:sterol desaturase/sphingolipid hydroxylase (fatty acid hydroxylase superfamily)
MEFSRDWLILGTFGAFVAIMMTSELIFRGRTWPKVAGWWARALALNAIQIGSAYLAAYGYDTWMHEHRLWSADGMGVLGGAAVGYVVITFLYYWWHRARHKFNFLWLWFHQVHHSPQRIEIITSFYKHPVEILGNGLLSSTILYFVVGVGPGAAAYAVLLTGVAELFYHWNVRTPYWLGFIIQRPESHCIHHQAGIHGYNYGDLPLWDILFGTFRNPKKWEAKCGFPGKEERLGFMLRGGDIYADHS